MRPRRSDRRGGHPMRAWLPDTRVTGPERATEGDIDRGVTTLGLETMPRTPENIGFYARLGFAPGFLTVTLTNEIATRGHPAPALLSKRSAAEKDSGVAAARGLVDDLALGVDFSRE